MSVPWWTCVFLLALLAALPAEAQETRGSIEGVVKDSSGAGLPGATVEARSPSLVGVASAVSDETGRYRFPSLSPGMYEVTAIMQGFQSVKVENVRLELGQILRVELTLSVAGVSENVQVVAESPIIDVKQNAAVGSVTSELIDRIPRGRNFTDLMQSAPGATPERKSGGIQIDGASGSENRFIIDGMDTTNLRTGVSQTDAVGRLHRRSAGEVERLQRRISRDDRRRDQRDHQVWRQHASAAASAPTTATTTGSARPGPNCG